MWLLKLTNIYMGMLHAAQMRYTIKKKKIVLGHILRRMLRENDSWSRILVESFYSINKCIKLPAIVSHIDKCVELKDDSVFSL